MYHRYQPDGQGQYRRQTFPDSPRPTGPPQKPPGPPPKPPGPPPKPPGPPPPKPPAPPDAPRFRLPFLEKLLPGCDGGDLLVLLILLLLLSEGGEESSSVAMTLAIFLFLQ